MTLMSKVSVHTSTSYDLFFSLFRIENNHAMTSDKNPDVEIRDWADWALTQLPTDMRKRLTIFFNEESGYAMTLCGYIPKWNPPNAIAFIKQLEEVPAQDMLLRFLYVGIGPGREVSHKYIDQLTTDEKEAFRFINEHLSFSPQEKWQAMQFLMSPEDMKQDLLKLLKWYLENIYLTVEERVAVHIARHSEELREKLRKYGAEYIKLLLPVDFRNQSEPQITLAVSYFLERSNSVNMIDNVYVYGYRYFERIEGKHTILAANQVFKTLADETRLNIIRMLLERPAYGHEIAQKLGISNSTVSHHVSMLVMRGLVRTYREDTRIYFELIPEEFRRVLSATIDNLLEEV